MFVLAAHLSGDARSQGLNVGSLRQRHFGGCAQAVENLSSDALDQKISFRILLSCEEAEIEPATKTPWRGKTYLNETALCVLSFAKDAAMRFPLRGFGADYAANTLVFIAYAFVLLIVLGLGNPIFL